MSTLESNDQLRNLVAAVSEKLKSVSEKSTSFDLSVSDAAQLIDHTLLSLDATSEQIDKLCEEALVFEFRAVCVRPEYVSLAKTKLLNSGIEVACVIGFPEGTHKTSEKVAEATKAITDGASELDMVLNYETLQRGDAQAAYDDVKAVREVASPSITLKVIFETSQLTSEQIVAACVLSCKAGADFVKTSTGFRGRGASLEDVKLMRAACDVATQLIGGKRVKIKASGGIRTGKDLINMADAGAERIGASAGVKIIEGLKEASSEGTPTQPLTDGTY